MPCAAATGTSAALVGLTMVNANDYALAYWQTLGLRVARRLAGLARRQDVHIPARS